MRRPWLILAWGIFILTVVDGGYLVTISSYSVNKYANPTNKKDYKQERLNGPVFSVLIETIDAVEGLITRHEKLLIVIFTGAIAWFTGTLWRATTGQLSVLHKSINLARKEFISTHRPRVIVKQVHLACSLEINKLVLIKFLIVNTGDTRAIIYDITGVVDVRKDELSGFPKYDDLGTKGLKDRRLILINGQREFQDFESKKVITEEDLRDIENLKRHLSIYGYISYKDDNDTIRSTAFCRIYDTKSGRFTIAPGAEPDYEYAE